MTENIWILLSLYLTKQATAAQIKLVQHWCNTSIKNQETFQLLCQIMQPTQKNVGEPSAMLTFDSTKAFKKLDNRIYLN